MANIRYVQESFIRLQPTSSPIQNRDKKTIASIPLVMLKKTQ